MDPNKGYSYSEGSTGWLEPRFLYGLALVVFFDGQYQEFQISVPMNNWICKIGRCESHLELNWPNSIDLITHISF